MEFFESSPLGLSMMIDVRKAHRNQLPIINLVSKKSEDKKLPATTTDNSNFLPFLSRAFQKVA